jgi:hypothetical protein
MVQSRENNLLIMNLNRLIDSAERVKLILNRFYRILLTSQDSRILFLEQFQLDVATYVYAINSFKELYLIINDSNKFNQLIQSNLTYGQASTFYNKNQLDNFITAIHFKLGNMIENILRKHFPKNRTQSFLGNISFLAEKTQLKEYLLGNLKVFNFYRNTNHNNGIHRGDDFTFKFRNNRIVFFEKDKPFYLPFICLDMMLLDILNSLVEVFSSSNIDWKIDIKDDFATRLELERT